MPSFHPCFTPVIDRCSNNTELECYKCVREDATCSAPLRPHRPKFSFVSNLPRSRHLLKTEKIKKFSTASSNQYETVLERTTSALKRPKPVDCFQQTQRFHEYGNLINPLSKCETLNEIIDVFYDLIETHKAMLDRNMLHRKISWESVLVKMTDRNKPQHADSFQQGARDSGKPWGYINTALGIEGNDLASLFLDFDEAVSNDSLVGKHERTGASMFMPMELSNGSFPSSGKGKIDYDDILKDIWKRSRMLNNNRKLTDLRARLKACRNEVTAIIRKAVLEAKYDVESEVEDEDEDEMKENEQSEDERLQPKDHLQDLEEEGKGECHKELEPQKPRLHIESIYWLLWFIVASPNQRTKTTTRPTPTPSSILP